MKLVPELELVPEPEPEPVLEPVQEPVCWTVPFLGRRVCWKTGLDARVATGQTCH